MFAQVQGNLSSNVATCEDNLGRMYYYRAKRALAADDLDRYVTNLELAASQYRESARIYRAVNHMDSVDTAARCEREVHEELHLAILAKAAVTLLTG